MTAYTQDTWILNVARRPATASAGRTTHYCRIELPAELLKAEAQQRAESIAMLFELDTAFVYRCDLTRWEVRGHAVSF